MSSQDEIFFAADNWLEFLEGELDPALEADMALLLVNSEGDRRILEDLALTREIIKAADGVALPEDGHYYDLLHARVMKGVRANAESRFAETITGAAAEADAKQEAKQNWAVVIDAIARRRLVDGTPVR